MSTHKLILATALLAYAQCVASADTPNLGKPITPAELAAWDITVMPDGTGLPPTKTLHIKILGLDDGPREFPLPSR